MSAVAEFTIRIPRVSVAVSEATLVEFLVGEGQHVEEGAPLFLIETEKVETEIAAGISGTVHWTGQAGIVYEIGAEIGVITS
jgi:pyruvate/2-oxoglutarate dehydrogenase complex dihydrolipoamide acyltransferase (E2) component